MSKYLETTYDKFTFRVQIGYRYSRDDLWARLEDGLVTVGLTDWLQRRSGDLALVELPAPGAQLVAGELCCTLDTMKATVEIVSPLTGQVIAVNMELERRPELINDDPYGQGWLFQLRPSDPSAVEQELLEAPAYFEWMLGRLEEEAKKLGH